VDAPGRASIGKRTLRTDKWWANPLATWILLTTWVAYATVRVFWREYYFAADYDYLSPFTSPCVSANCAEGSSIFGVWFPFDFPPFVPFAVITLVFLLGFRTTCYNYRKAYYRAFARTPSACAVPEPHKKYNGETKFPLIFQNAHRYFFYAAVIISLVNTYDVIHSLFHGIGLGTLIMAANVVLLWCYTLGCHACRHAIGGQLRHFSKHPIRYKLWRAVSKLTDRHMQFAWTTLGTLMFTDAYIWMVSANPSMELFYIHF
jgi:hypothetical protein